MRGDDSWKTEEAAPGPGPFGGKRERCELQRRPAVSAESSRGAGPRGDRSCHLEGGPGRTGLVRRSGRDDPTPGAADGRCWWYRRPAVVTAVAQGWVAPSPPPPPTGVAG